MRPLGPTEVRAQTWRTQEHVLHVLPPLTPPSVQHFLPGGGRAYIMFYKNVLYISLWMWSRFRQCFRTGIPTEYFTGKTTQSYCLYTHVLCICVHGKGRYSDWSELRLRFKLIFQMTFDVFGTQVIFSLWMFFHRVCASLEPSVSKTKKIKNHTLKNDVWLKTFQLISATTKKKKVETEA